MASGAEDRLSRVFAKQTVSREERMAALNQPPKRPAGRIQPISRVPPQPTGVVNKPVTPGVRGATPAPGELERVEPNANATSEIKEEPKVVEAPPPPPPPATQAPRFERTPKLNNAKWDRIDLPSRFLAYSFKEMNIRKFVPADLIKFDKARRSRNLTVAIDVLGDTIDQDIRDLTIPDYRYLWYWHRLNSYLKTPFTITWTSKYGNEANYTINKSDIKVQYLEMSEQEYQQWMDKGLYLPRVRDYELVQNGMPPDTLLEFERAQFLQGDTLEDRIAKLYNADDISILEDISEFQTKLTFGVLESVKLTDRKFDPKVWMERLEDMSSQLKEFGSDEDLELATTFDDQVATIKDQLDRGETVAPEEQEVPLAFSEWTFFPSL